MIKVNADVLVQIGKTLQSLQDALAQESLLAVCRAEDQTSFVKVLQNFKSNTDGLKLVATSAFLDAVIVDYSSKPHTFGETRSTIEHVSTVFQQELERYSFTQVNPERAKYLRTVDDAVQNPHFGPEVQAAFTSAATDIRFAGNCLAFGMTDACAFHLMRVLEKGLAALAKVLSEPFQFQDWHNVIERLESKIRKMGPGDGADWKTKQQFYSEAALTFMFFKDAWRNHVMHGRTTYDMEQAISVYEHVGTFMRHLARGGLTE